MQEETAGRFIRVGSQRLSLFQMNLGAAHRGQPMQLSFVCQQDTPAECAEIGTFLNPLQRVCVITRGDGACVSAAVRRGWW